MSLYVDGRQRSHLLHLAQVVNDATADIVRKLGADHQPEPTDEVNSMDIPDTEPFLGAKQMLNNAASELVSLINGPRTSARNHVLGLFDLAALQVAFEFSIFDTIPENGYIELEDMAKQVGMDGDRLGRVLKLLATERIFEEVQVYKVGLQRTSGWKHTARSVAFKRERGLRDAGQYQLDEFFKAAAETAESIKASPLKSNGSNCAFAFKHGMPAFEFYQKNPLRAARFASAMAGIGRLERQFESLRDIFPWNTIDGTIVDIGGGNGHMAIALAQVFDKINITVQDSFEMISKAPQIESSLIPRVSFMVHDFFTPQPITSASAYLLRQVTHNWNDEDCIRIIRAVVPALEKSGKNTPLFINEIVLPELDDSGDQTNKYEERRLRQVDMMMMIAFGAKQRARNEFRMLLRKADHRLEIVKIHGNGSLKLIEVHLKEKTVVSA